MLKRAFFLQLGKTEKSQLEQHSKIPESCCKLGETWKYSLRPILKNPNFESTDELRKFKFHC